MVHVRECQFNGGWYRCLRCRVADKPAGLIHGGCPSGLQVLKNSNSFTSRVAKLSR
jgi:hypothetical protein